MAILCVISLVSVYVAAETFRGGEFASERPGERRTAPSKGERVSEMRLGVDVGGTFTDLVALSAEGTLVTAKVPSTPQDQSEGVMNAIDASEVEPDAVTALAHGMTVATNALLERRGARTALVTTEGSGTCWR